MVIWAFTKPAWRLWREGIGMGTATIGPTRLMIEFGFPLPVIMLSARGVGVLIYPNAAFSRRATSWLMPM